MTDPLLDNLAKLKARLARAGISQRELPPFAFPAAEVERLMLECGHPERCGKVEPGTAVQLLGFHGVAV